MDQNDEGGEAQKDAAVGALLIGRKLLRNFMRNFCGDKPVQTPRNRLSIESTDKKPWNGENDPNAEDARQIVLLEPTIRCYLLSSFVSC